MSAHDEQQAKILEAAMHEEWQPSDCPLLDWHQALRAGAAALRRASPETGWQPIETAPKDGTPVLLFIDAAQLVVAAWKDIDGDIATWVAESEDCCPQSWEGYACWDDISDQPTHWMLLPSAPAPSEDK